MRPLAIEGPTDNSIDGDAPPPESIGFSVRRAWGIVRRRSSFILAIVGIACFIALVTQLLATPMYESRALVQVELNAEGDLSVGGSDRERSRVANEARTYRSRSLAEQVVRDLELIHNDEFMNGNPVPEGRTSQPIIQRATTRLQSMRRINIDQGSDFIEIAIRTPDATLSAAIANQYVESMQDRKLRLREIRREEVAAELDAEAARLREVALEAQQRLSDFRSENNMPVGAGSSEDYSQFNRIEVEAASAAGMSAAGSARSAGASRAASMRTTAGASSSLLQQQQRRMDELVNEQARLSVLYGAGHPDVQRVEAEIASLSQNMAAEQQRAIAAENARVSAEAGRERALAQSEASAASARAGRLAGQLNALRQRMQAHTENMPQLARLENDVLIAREAFVQVAQRAETIRSSQDSSGINSTLVSPSTASSDPVSPRPLRTVAATLVGSTMLALLLVYVLELFDNRIRTADQIRRLFGLRTLGMFPIISGTSLMSTEDNPVIKDPQSLFAEVARSMQADVADLPYDGECQSILITSPLPADGKSTIALSLVAAASAMGRRAILLDLDLRRPSPLQAIQREVPGPDLVDYLANAGTTTPLLPGSASEAEREIKTHKPVILSTRDPVRDPASLITASRLHRLHADLRESFDLVVINGPAALAVRDARTLTEIADSTIMVTSWAVTTVEQMRAAIESLQGKIDAAVINKVDYVEHARRGYGDSIQYYYESSPYYSGPVPSRESLGRRIRESIERIIPARFKRSDEDVY